MRKFGVETSLKPFRTITRLKETPSHPSMTLGHPASIECPRAPGKGKGPFIPPKPPLLVNDATYAVEQVISIIKEEDINDCDEFTPIAIGESGCIILPRYCPLTSLPFFVYLFSAFHLFNSLCAFQAMVRMKTFELRCGDYEDQMVNLWKRVKNNNEVIKELQGFVTPLTEKVAFLEGKVKEPEKQCSSQVDLFVAAKEEKIRLSKELEKLRGELRNAETSVIAKYFSS
nr:hypothetical protein CFP56_26422 [Quercus suber]